MGLRRGEARPDYDHGMCLERVGRKRSGEMEEWYVIQTVGGEEERTAHLVRKLVPADCLADCFVPKRERLKKFHGRWNRVEEVLFHGYAFVVSERPGDLYEELRRIPRLTKVLGRDGDWFLGLGEGEERLVRGLGGESRRVPLSKVSVREGGKVCVVDGPLKDYAGHVVRVNLHKREAVIRVEFMGREMELKMGVEMVEAWE